MTIQDDAGFAHIIAARGSVGSFFILILQIKPNAPPFRIQQRATRVAGLEADKKDVLHPKLARLLMRARRAPMVGRRPATRVIDDLIGADCRKQIVLPKMVPGVAG